MNLELPRKTLYAILSGEHVTLPLAELKAIIESEGYYYHQHVVLDQLVLFDSEPQVAEKITHRAGMVREVGLFLDMAPASIDEYLSKIKDLNLCSIVKDDFIIRSRRFKGHSRGVNIDDFIGALAGRIIRECRARVNPMSPSTVIRLLFTDGVVIIGLMLARANTRIFTERSPAKKPFFRPGALSVQLSRVFVNLSRPKKNRLYLDPFCGTGGFLVEAGFMGFHAIGFDLNEIMVEGARINLDYYGLRDIEVLRADATRIPLHAESIGAIGTDPPYGRSTSTMGYRLSEIIEGFVYSASEVLEHGSYLVFATPHIFDARNIIEEAELVLIERHYMRVHGSLTRILWVVYKS